MDNKYPEKLWDKLDACLKADKRGVTSWTFALVDCDPTVVRKFLDTSDHPDVIVRWAREYNEKQEGA